MLKRKKRQESIEETTPESEKKGRAEKEPREESHDDVRDTRGTRGVEGLPLPQAANGEFDRNIISKKSLHLPAESSQLPIQSSSNQALLPSKESNGNVVESVRKNVGFYDVKLNTDLVPGVHITEYIGSGSYSTVWKAVLRWENVERAVKISIGNEKHNRVSREEIKLLVKMTNNREDIGYKNICSYYGHYLINGPERKHYALLLELLPCNFRHHLRDIETLSLERIQGFFSDILEALQFLHNTCGIVHADLKTENILVSNAGNPSNREVLKITDFGISFMKTDPPLRTITTCSHRAPEAFLCAQIGTASDMWSFACIAFEIVRNSLLFRCQHLDQGLSKERHDHFQFIAALLGPIEKNIFRKERHNEQIFEEVFRSEATFNKTVYGMQENYLSPDYFVKYSKMPDWIAQQLVDFLLNILQIDPDIRLTATEALRHSFLSLKNENENSPVTVRFIKPTCSSTSPTYEPSTTNNPKLSRYRHNSPSNLTKFRINNGSSPTYGTSFSIYNRSFVSLSSPSYSPKSPLYRKTTLAYNPSSPVYCPKSPLHNEAILAYNPSSPVYCPKSPLYSQTSPTYSPKSSSCHP